MKMQLSCGCCVGPTCITKWLPNDVGPDVTYPYRIRGDLRWNISGRESIDYEVNPNPTSPVNFADRTHNFGAYGVRPNDGLRASWEVTPETPVVVHHMGFPGPYRFVDDVISNRNNGQSYRLNDQEELTGKFNYEEPHEMTRAGEDAPCRVLFEGEVQETASTGYVSMYPNQPTLVSINYDKVPTAFSLKEDQSSVHSITLPAIPEIDYPEKTVYFRAVFPSTCGAGPHGLQDGTLGWRNDGGTGFGPTRPQWTGIEGFPPAWGRFYYAYTGSAIWKYSDLNHTWQDTEQVSVGSSSQFDYTYDWQDGRAEITVDKLYERVSTVNRAWYWRFQSGLSTINSGSSGQSSGSDTTAILQTTPIGIEPDQNYIRLWQMKTTNQGIRRWVTFQQICDAMGIDCDSGKFYPMRIIPNDYNSDGPPSEFFSSSNSWGVPIIANVTAVFAHGFVAGYRGNVGQSQTNELAGNPPAGEPEDELKPPTWAAEIEGDVYRDSEPFQFDLEQESSSFDSDVTGSFSIERTRVPPEEE